MVLTKAELIQQLQHEVHILLHLASKIDPNKLDYRPTAKQRSTLELLQYMSLMGPEIVKSVRTGTFDTVSWTKAEETAFARTFDETLAAIAAQKELYASEVGSFTDADLRAEVDMFGQKSSRGSALVSMLLCGCAAYRTQLFLYLKACGREELNTMNLWAGIDGQM